MSEQGTEMASKGPMRGRRMAVQSSTNEVSFRQLQPGSSMLVIEPADNHMDLAAWIDSHSPLIDEKLLRHGALLFRGFGVGDPVTFERFANVVCRTLLEENGEHPRQSLAGRVYTPVFFAPQMRLLWHNENSFNREWPTRIMFACVKPATTGGATPVVDGRQVYQRLDPAIREHFVTRQIMYTRNYGTGVGLDWTEVFQTKDKSVVEQKCLASGIEYEWRSGNRLRTRCVRPAVIRHPHTNDWVWFGQPQHWHVSCLDEATRKSLMAVFAEEDWPRHCYYGDGTPIRDEDMQVLLEVYAGLEERFQWQSGDVMLLDNLLMAHGRDAYSGERKLLVAMGDMGSF
jgi:alpha-ketoglutarate-dependent taurine dioxygenase